MWPTKPLLAALLCTALFTPAYAQVTSVVGQTGDVTAAQLSAALAGVGLSGSSGELDVQYGTTGTTAAAGNDSRITGAAQKSSNLSDLSSVSAARTNLGLGTAATLNTGTSGSVVPVLSAPNTWAALQTFSGGLTVNPPSGTALLSVGSPTSSAASVNLTAIAGGSTQVAYRIASFVNWATGEDSTGSWSLNRYDPSTGGFLDRPLSVSGSGQTTLRNKLTLSTSGSITSPAGVLGLTATTHNTGINGGGYIWNYLSSSIAPGFDVGETGYAYFDPTFPSPVTFTGHLTAGNPATLTLDSAASGGTGTIAAGTVLTDESAAILSGTVVLYLASGVDGQVGATYAISKSQTVASESITAAASHPGEYQQFKVAVCPNDTANSWGCDVAEWDVSNRGVDAGFKRARSDKNVAGNTSTNNPTGGLLIVPEVSNFADPYGSGQGTNASFAYSLARSASSNSVSGIPNAFYAGYLVEPNSIVGGTGRGIYETGDISGTVSRFPYAPIDWDGTWAHGLMAAYATFSDNAALTISPGQGIANIVGYKRAVDKLPVCDVGNTCASSSISATGNPTTGAAGWNITTAGSGTVTISGPLQLKVTTVASLPACNSAATGEMLAVSDATAPTYNGTLTGGGAVAVPVFCNGTAWTAH